MVRRSGCRGAGALRTVPWHTAGVAGDSLYDVLGVQPGATTDEIRAAFRTLSKKVHPDQGGSAALFRRVQEAYDTLSDPRRRAAYDRSLREPSPSEPPGTSEDEATGWVRTDTPPGPGWGGTTGPKPPPRSSQPPPEAGAYTWPPPPGRPPPNAPPGPGSYGSGAGWDASMPSRPGPSLWARHPAVIVTTCGLVLLWFGEALGRAGAFFTGLGFLTAAAGVLAMTGSRRARGRYDAVQASLVSIDEMSGTQFEVLLTWLFTTTGYRVSRVAGSGDLGADLLLDGPGGRTTVQAKRWSAPVGHAAVQQVVAAMAYYRARGAMVVTNATFSRHARRLAESNQVVLWDRDVLARELRRARGVPPATGAALFWPAVGAGMTLLWGWLNRLARVTASYTTSSGSKWPPRRRRR